VAWPGFGVRLFDNSNFDESGFYTDPVQLNFIQPAKRCRSGRKCASQPLADAQRLLLRRIVVVTVGGRTWRIYRCKEKPTARAVGGVIQKLFLPWARNCQSCPAGEISRPRVSPGWLLRHCRPPGSATVCRT
jgi:hypothetical protein